MFWCVYVNYFVPFGPVCNVGKFANWVSAFATVWQNGETGLGNAGKTQKYQTQTRFGAGPCTHKRATSIFFD
jgi:hypothetical protein